MDHKYIHIDLFSGIGGFSLGLKQAGFPISKTYFSEVDKYAITVYKKQFPKAEYLGAVESVSRTRFKNRKTIITFGFPCQDLSIAGKRKGFDGSRSSLFFEATRIISEVKPSIFIFENVKGFYSSNDGKNFQIALQTIADIGLYECEWQLLNTAWFLPQNRERIYFIGHLAGSGGSKVFPVRENDFRIKQRNGKASKVRTLSAGGNSGGLHSNMTLLCSYNRKEGIKQKIENSFPLNSTDWRGLNRNQDQNAVVSIGTLRTHKYGEGFRKIKDGLCPSIPARAREDGSGQPVVNMKIANSVTPDAYLTKGARKRDRNGKAVLTSMFERRIRRLTPIECERLQGFPDNWTKYGHEGQEISDTQRYKMCGNAVSVPVVKEIGNRCQNT